MGAFLEPFVGSQTPIDFARAQLREKQLREKRAPAITP
jgi:hypothetical protein